MCTRNLEQYKAFMDKIGSFDFSQIEPLLYSSPDTLTKDYVWIEFFCLISIKRWCFDESSKVYIRFASAELGTWYTCHGPMTSTRRFVIFAILYRKNNVIAECYTYSYIHLYIYV